MSDGYGLVPFHMKDSSLMLASGCAGVWASLWTFVVLAWRDVQFGRAACTPQHSSSSPTSTLYVHVEALE